MPCSRTHCSVSAIIYFVVLFAVALVLSSLGTFAGLSGAAFHPLCWGAPVLLSGAVAGMIRARRRGVAVLPPGRMLLWLTLFSLVCAYAFTPTAYSAPLCVHITLMMAAGAMCLSWGLLRQWSFVFWAPFLLWELIQSAAFVQYGTRINSLVLAETLESSWEEALAYISVLNVVLLGVAIALVWCLCRLIKRMLQAAERVALCNAGMLLCGGSLLFCFPLPGEDFEHELYWPVGELAAIYLNFDEAFHHNIATVRLVESLPSPAEQPSSISTLNGDEGVVLVVHVGESLRADRMSINGYAKDTTPWLRSCRHIINFPQCVSAACDTCQAQIAILTDARRDIYETAPDMVAHTGSVLELFHANGFRLYSFMGIPYNSKLKYDRVIRLLTRCSQQRFNSGSGPWGSVPQIQKVLQENPTANLVFFINNEGSHTPFKYYDHDNPPFTPASSNFQNPAANALPINNAYDNTVHYTDEFFRRVAESLQGRPFVYLYVSDHGEYLGQNGIWGRGGLGESGVSYHETDGCYVGMFVLYSPEFAALHPHFAQALQQMQQKTSTVVAHEHIFHTLLGLFGIKTPHYNPALDLCSPTAQPYAGPHPGADSHP